MDIKELEQKLRTYREAYYNGMPLVSDAVYDELEDELRSRDPENGFFDEVGFQPDQKTKWQKVQHSVPMTSLNKVNTIEELSDWAAKTKRKALLTGDNELAWSEKLDGISIALYYENGKLVQALTRGDGQVGEDIIANAVMMKGVPNHLPRDIDLVVRGEIVLTHDMWREQFSDYSNPRNAASGIAKREERGKAQDCQYLTVYIYEAFADVGFPTEMEKFAFIEDLGFKTPSYGWGTNVIVLDRLYDAYQNGMREDLVYDIDGLVVRLNQSKAFKEVGMKGGRPRGAVALKFPNEAATTRLKDIKWQVGTTGRITPVAHFEPVDLVGATVKRASLYNAAYIEELGGLQINDEIVVSRANDVIPRVEEVTKRMDGFALQPPTGCPECGEPTEWDGEYLICDNVSECPALAVGRIRNWIDSLGLLDWGLFITEKIIEEGLVQDIAGLYELTPEDLKDLRNANDAVLGEKKAHLLVDTLHDKTEVRLDELLGGLSISNCRQLTIQMLMDAGYKTVDDILDLSVSEMEQVEGIGEKKAKNIKEGLEQNESLIRELLTHVTVEKAGGPLEGLSFCLTGSMSKSRKLIYQDIKDAGGKKSGVKRSLDYLVAADPSSNSSKATKARKYEIPVISESDLYDMMQ